MKKKKSEETIVAETFLELLRNLAPELFEIEALNKKFLAEMEFGEIHIVEYIKGGKVWRIEAMPKISKMVKDEMGA
jgi:hypothetical protein